MEILEYEQQLDGAIQQEGFRKNVALVIKEIIDYYKKGDHEVTKYGEVGNEYIMSMSAMTDTEKNDRLNEIKHTFIAETENISEEDARWLNQIIDNGLLLSTNND